MYTASVQFNTVEGKYPEMLMAVDELNLSELNEHVQKHMITEANDWVSANLMLCLRLCSQLGACQILQEHCEFIIAEEPSLLFDSPDYTSLDEEVLIRVLKRADLNVDENIVWSKVLEWSLAQADLTNAPQDMDKWSKDEVVTFKKTIAPLLPLVRYVSISREFYCHNILPYRDAFPDDLKNASLHPLLVPDERRHPKLLPKRERVARA
jgi:hypothetical protein